MTTNEKLREILFTLATLTGASVGSNKYQEFKKQHIDEAITAIEELYKDYIPKVEIKDNQDRFFWNRWKEENEEWIEMCDTPYTVEQLKEMSGLITKEEAYQKAKEVIGWTYAKGDSCMKASDYEYAIVMLKGRFNIKEDK